MKPMHSSAGYGSILSLSDWFVLILVMFARDFLAIMSWS